MRRGAARRDDARSPRPCARSSGCGSRGCSSPSRRRCTATPPVVAGEVRRTRTALLARAFRPRTALQAAPVGRVAGTLFLRAHARGERVHRAMLARGTLRAHPPPSVRGRPGHRCTRPALLLWRRPPRARRRRPARGARRARRGARAQRRRQDDAHAAPQRAPARGGRPRRRGHRRRRPPAARAARAGRRRVPGSGRPALHADGRRGRRLRPAQPRPGRRRGGPARPPARSPRSGCATPGTGRRTRCRRASGAARRSPPSSRWTRRCSCWTSRPPTSIPGAGASSSSCCAASAAPSSSSRTTSRSPPRCASARSC